MQSKLFLPLLTTLIRPWTKEENRKNSPTVVNAKAKMIQVATLKGLTYG